MTAEAGGFPALSPEPEMELVIQGAEGADADRLRIEQTRVIKEVVEWLDQRRSRNGSTSTAA